MSENKAAYDPLHDDHLPFDSIPTAEASEASKTKPTWREVWNAITGRSDREGANKPTPKNSISLTDMLRGMAGRDIRDTSPKTHEDFDDQILMDGDIPKSPIIDRVRDEDIADLRASIEGVRNEPVQSVPVSDDEIASLRDDIVGVHDVSTEKVSEPVPLKRVLEKPINANELPEGSADLARTTLQDTIRTQKSIEESLIDESDTLAGRERMRNRKAAAEKAEYDARRDKRSILQRFFGKNNQPAPEMTREAAEAMLKPYTRPDNAEIPSDETIRKKGMKTQTDVEDAKEQQALIDRLDNLTSQ